MLTELVYEPDKDLQRMLNDFIQGNVFVYEEEGLYECDVDNHRK